MPVLDKSRNEAPRRGPGESASPAAAADARDSFRGSLVEIETRVLDEVSASLETKHTTTGSPADSVAVTSNGSDDSAARSAARPASAKSASPTTAADAEGTSSPPSPKPTDSPQIPEGAKIRKGSKPDPQSRTETQGKGAPPKDSATKSAGGSKAPAPTNRKPSSMSPTDPASATTSKPSTPDTMSPPPPKETAKQKGSRSPPIKYELQLYRDLPDVTAEATSTFDVIDQCIYSSKWIGDSGQDTEFMPCECKPDFVGSVNHACDDESDCINRLTLMECGNDGCGCDSKCSNQRFQTRDYANVSVFKTAKKGYGLRANVDISAGRFIYEYVGEVIDEPRFHQRNAKYPTMGVKHFYFMSLEKDQFIDATMKGGLARFVNHSCNPNCETEKWVVGKKYRMGIFARRDVKAGEELVFDYNVDRYGAEKQPCYCGEPNCLGYIGGKTQTNSGPKLSGNLIEALGIDEDDLPTTKSKRTRKTAEEDDEYLARAGNKPLESGQVVNVMGTLSSTGEKWVVSKLLSRIQKCDEEDVLTRVLRFHGYTIIGKFLTVYKDDEDIVSTILGIFINFPKMSKNKITAAGIEPSVEALTSSPSPEISTKAKEVLAMWSGLETAYRIPRRLAGDQPEQVNTIFLDRCRDSRSTSHTESPSRSPKASTEPIPPWLQNKNKPNFNNKPPPSFAKQPPRGPRADRERFGIHGRPTHAFTPRPNFENPNMTPTGPKMDRSRTGDLPWGWNKCYQFNECYYYANDGRVSWDVPTQPCNAHGPPTSIPPPPPKAGQVKEIQALIQEAAAAAEADRQKKDDEEKERERAERRAKRKVGKTYDAEKTQKYLSIAFGKHVPNMVNKYKLELSHNPTSAKEQVKKYSKEIVELLVNKEIRYHKGTVVDPLNVCDESKIIKIKQFVDDYMGKLVERRKTHIKPEPKSRSPSAKRKHDSDSDLPSDPKRVKSPSPAPNTPTNKRSHSSNIRRESPKRRLSLSNSPNRVF